VVRLLNVTGKIIVEGLDDLGDKFKSADYK
jgi:hypothetical protein